MLHSFIERSACPSCESVRLSRAFSCAFDEAPVAGFIRDHYGIEPTILRQRPYELVSCDDCTLLFQRYVGDEKLLSALYGEWVNDHSDPETDAFYQADIRAPSQSRDAHELMAAARFLDVPLNKLVTLDYGMGWALWARIALALGCHSYGHDMAQPRMDYAASQGVRTLTDEEISGQQFHFINLEQVLEHVADPRTLIHTLAQALAPGGVLKVSLPRGDRWPRIVDRLENRRSTRTYASYAELMPVQPLEHINCYTARALIRLASDMQLEVVTPSLNALYAFVRYPGSYSASRPKKTLKELVRPFYQFHNQRNLYRWFRKENAERQCAR